MRQYLLIAAIVVGVMLTVVLANGRKEGPLQTETKATGSIYNFNVKDINGNDYKLDQLRGKVVMIVNVASKCGYTPQYEGLQALYQKYQDKGLVVLGFPANNFMGCFQVCAVD